MILSLVGVTPTAPINYRCSPLGESDKHACTVLPIPCCFCQVQYSCSPYFVSVYGSFTAPAIASGVLPGYTHRPGKSPHVLSSWSALSLKATNPSQWDAHVSLIACSSASHSERNTQTPRDGATKLEENNGGDVPGEWSLDLLASVPTLVSGCQSLPDISYAYQLFGTKRRK